MIVEYCSNNSGGSWWLDKKDWINLEKAGWIVVTGEYEYDDDGGHKVDKNGFPIFKKGGEDGINWLGAYAKYAYRKLPTIEQAKEEFENITGQYANEEGCECCGKPHNFYEYK